MQTKPWIRRVAIALTAATVGLTPAVAHASSGSSEAGPSLMSSFSQPGSSGVTLDTIMSSVDLLGLADKALPDNKVGLPDTFPYPIDETITETRLVNREVSPQDGTLEKNAERRIERWTIASPSMGRNMLVDVRPAANPDGPILILLDGLEAPIRNGWLYGPGSEEVDEVFTNENVTLVFPLDANGTWYSDWVNDDPVLGRQKWETFIVDEMLPTIEAQDDIYFNGKRGIGGLSMGAAGAVHLANQHPELFDATFGLSGCYTTSIPIGKQIAYWVPASRGANALNMWGPEGSEEWQRHDVSADPSGLANQAVYLVTANGESENEGGSSENFFESPFTMGHFLERGVLACTYDLEQQMLARGMTHQEVKYKGPGLHNWGNFEEELAPAWEHIKPALY